MKLALLGMPDNDNTRQFRLYLESEFADWELSVIYWKPDFRNQLQRTLRKLRLAGAKATTQRISQALKIKKSRRRNEQFLKYADTTKEFWVSHHNSEHCAEIIIKQKIDLVLLSTDAILTKKVLRAPRLLTLNAHPGLTPRYRGLGSLFYMLQDGLQPVVSVHAVDEGIDTGPLLYREVVPVDPKTGLESIVNTVLTQRLSIVGKVLRAIELDGPTYQDTFLEQSAMTRGMPLAERQNLDEALKTGKIQLTLPQHEFQDNWAP
jgi:folate-dependent phosphoribosylglycinamide formyltransferase PurN